MMFRTLIMILFFTCVNHAQESNLLLYSGQTFWTTEAVTGTNGTVGAYHIITGTAPRTKSDKDNGSVRSLPYLSWWLSDSINIIKSTDTTWLTSAGIWTANSSGDTLTAGEPTGGNYGIFATRNSGKFPYFGIDNYSYSFKILNYVGGEVRVGLDNSWGDWESGDGTHTGDITYSSDYHIKFQAGSLPDFEGVITDILLYPTVDSIQALTKVFDIDDLIEDTTYNYRASTVPQGGNDSYSQGEDSTFIIALPKPEILLVECTDDYEATISWTASTTRNGLGTTVLRDTSGGVSPDSVATVAKGTTVYVDSGDVLLNGEYIYSLVNRGYNSLSDTSVIGTVLINLPNNQFTFEPSSINLVVDSTAGGAGGAESGEIYADDFEDGNGDWTENSEAGNTITVDTDTVANGSQSIKFLYGGSNEDNEMYTTIDVNGSDSIFVRWNMYYSENWRPGGGSANDYTDVFQLFDADVGGIIHVRNRNGADNMSQWGIWSNGQPYDDGSNVILGEWHYVEVGYYQGTGSNDGWCTIRVNGDSATTDATWDYSGYEIDRIHFGNNHTSVNATGQFFIDDVRVDTSGWIGDYVAGSGSADTSITVRAIASNGEITVDAVTGVGSPFTVAVDSSYSFVVADGDTVIYTFTLDRDTIPGTYFDTAVFEFDVGQDQGFSLYAQVLGLDLSDTTKPNPVASLDLEGFNEGATPKTYNIYTWTAPNSPSSDAFYYRVMRCDTEGEDPCLGWDSIGVVFSLDTLTFVDTVVTAGDFYYGRVDVIDDTLNVSENNPTDSTTTPATIPPDVPAAPSSLTATSDTTTSDLSWTDNADNELAYLIEKKLLSAEGYTQEDSIAADETSYEVTGLAYATTYNYRVRGVNANGYSNYSNVATATTVDTVTSPAGSFYVDGNVAVSGDGTSWANAWKTFAAIVWDSLDGGNTSLYISGGSDSTIYNELLYIPTTLQGTAANNVIIIAGKYAPSSAGHSGRVIVDASIGPLNWSLLVGQGGSSPQPEYITIKGFEFRGGYSAIKIENYANCITIDSNYCYDYLAQGGIWVCGYEDGIDSTVIKNNTIITAITGAPGQTDGIYLCETVNTLITDNFIHIRNQADPGHLDGIQTWYPKNRLIIKNNVIINDSVAGTETGGMPLIIRTHLEADSLPYITYNNFLYMGGLWANGSGHGNVMDFHSGDLGDKDPGPTYVIHNTVVGNGPHVHGLSYSYFGLDNNGTAINNIAAMFGDGLGSFPSEVWWMDALGIGGVTDVDSMRSHLLWREWAVDNPFPLIKGDFTDGSTTIGDPTWAQWLSLGGTGVNANPLFVNNFGNEPDQGVLRGNLQDGSPAINAGEDARWLLTWLNNKYNLEGEWALEWEDIDGNARVDHADSVTIGAYNPPWNR